MKNKKTLIEYKIRTWIMILAKLVNLTKEKLYKKDIVHLVLFSIILSGTL